MKRILVLALAFILAFSSMIFPSYAAEFDSGEWIELLDYGSVSSGGSESSDGNFFSFSNSYDMYLTVPSTMQLFSIDMVVFFDSAPLTSVFAIWGDRTTDLNIIDLGNHMYRIYGDLPSGNYATLHLVWNASGTAYATLLSCRVSQVSVSSFRESVVGFLAAGGVWRDLYYTAGSQGVYTSIDVNSSGSWTYGAGFRLDNWKGYDFYDVLITFSGAASITSISAYMVDSNGDPLANPLELDLSYISNSFYNDADYELIIRVDLRGFDRDLDLTPVININGEHGGQHIEFGIYDAVGYVFANVEEPSDFFLRKILASVSSGFNSVGVWFQNLASSIESFFNIQTSSIVNALVDIKNNVISLCSDIYYHLTFIRNDMWSIWGGLAEKLDQYLGSSGDNDKFENDVAQQGDKLDQMDDALSSVTKPALDRVDTNISGFVSDADLANTAHVYTYIIDDNILAPALTMVTILAMMSFALFGKR